MSQLGLKQSAGSAELCGDTQGSVTASREQYNELDADVIVLNDASGQGLPPGLMGGQVVCRPAGSQGRQADSAARSGTSHGLGFTHVAERQICFRGTGLEDERVLTS